MIVVSYWRFSTFLVKSISQHTVTNVACDVYSDSALLIIYILQCKSNNTGIVVWRWRWQAFSSVVCPAIFVGIHTIIVVTHIPMVYYVWTIHRWLSLKLETYFVTFCAARRVGCPQDIGTKSFHATRSENLHNVYVSSNWSLLFYVSYFLGFAMDTS